MLKKGLSALISAVFLILLAITVSTFIYNFSKGSVESGLEKGEEIFEGFENCDEVVFSVEDAYCNSNEGIVRIKMRNEKKIDFKDAFALRVFYEGQDQEVGSFLDQTQLLAYEIKEIAFGRVSLDREVLSQLTGILINERYYPEIKEIEIVPKVKAGKKFQFCNEKKQKIEVRDCTEETLS